MSPHDLYNCGPDEGDELIEAERQATRRMLRAFCLAPVIGAAIWLVLWWVLR